MQDSDFIKMIAKTGRRMGIIGFFILAFAVLMAWIFFSGVDSESEGMGTGGKITGLIFVLLFVFVGILMLVISIRTSSKIRQGKHPLINALSGNGDPYILWYYEHVTHVKSGPAKNTAHNIWLLGRDKKQYTINVKKGKVEEAFDYLATKFPNAMVGYSKEMEAAYNEQVKANN